MSEESPHTLTADLSLDGIPRESLELAFNQYLEYIEMIDNCETQLDVSNAYTSNILSRLGFVKRLLSTMGGTPIEHRKAHYNILCTLKDRAKKHTHRKMASFDDAQ